MSSINPDSNLVRFTFSTGTSEVNYAQAKELIKTLQEDSNVHVFAIQRQGQPLEIKVERLSTGIFQGLPRYLSLATENPNAETFYRTSSIKNLVQSRLDQLELKDKITPRPPTEALDEGWETVEHRVGAANPQLGKIEAEYGAIENRLYSPGTLSKSELNSLLRTLERLRDQTKEMIKTPPETLDVSNLYLQVLEEQIRDTISVVHKRLS